MDVETLLTGSEPPDFTLFDQDDISHELSSYRGHWLLLLFYSHDTIASCAKEICSLRDHFEAFKKLDIKILGISPDSTKNHKDFSEKNHIPFPLLSDPGRKTAEQYHAIGRDYYMNRETTSQMSFLINVGGEIEKIYDRIDPNRHASEILADFLKIQQEDTDEEGF